MKSKLLSAIIVLSVFLGATANLLACFNPPVPMINTVEVYDVNDLAAYPAYIDSNGDYHVTINQAVVFNCSAFDEDGDTLTYGLDYQSDGIDEDTGSISFKANFSEVHIFTNIGTYTVTLTVEDDIHSSTDSITVHVGPARVNNKTKSVWYSHIQHAVSGADNGDIIIASKDTYFENIDFSGKNITVKSTAPTDPNTVASTIINGNGFDPVVSFDGTEEPNSILAGLTITSEIPVPNLIAHWKLDETDGNSINCALDNYDGTIESDPNWQSAAGHINGALLFDGNIDNYATVNYSSELNPGSFTVAFWAKVTGNQDLWRTPICSRDYDYSNSTATGYNIYASPINNWQFWTGTGGSGFRNIAGPNVELNKWTHIVATFVPTSGPDAGGIYTGTKSLYINGSLYVQSTSESYKPNTTESLYIGRPEWDDLGTDPQDGRFHGLLDDVRIYSRALSNSDIEILFANNPTDSVSHWMFDSVSGTPLTSPDEKNVADATLNGNASITSTVGEYLWDSGALKLTGSGTGDCATANGIVSNIAGKNITLALWVKSNQSTSQESIVAFNVSDGNNRFFLGHPSNYSTLSLYDPLAGGWNHTNFTVFDGSWHHVVYVLNDHSNTGYIYVDGDVSNRFSINTTCSISSSDLFSIGQEYDYGPIESDYFDGYIDNMYLYDRQLTEVEIGSLYKTGLVKYGGGINGNKTSATMLNCVIKGNNADYGGGIYAVDGAIINCTVTNNAAIDGGGIADCNAFIINSIISDNTAEGYGGGFVDCPGNIINCTVANDLPHFLSPVLMRVFPSFRLHI